MPRLYTYENVPLLIYPKNGVNNLNDERSFTVTNVQYRRYTVRVHDASRSVRSVSHLSSAMTSAAAPGWRQADDGSDC